MISFTFSYQLVIALTAGSCSDSREQCKNYLPRSNTEASMPSHKTVKQVSVKCMHAWSFCANVCVCLERKKKMLIWNGSSHRRECRATVAMQHRFVGLWMRLSLSVLANCSLAAVTSAWLLPVRRTRGGLLVERAGAHNLPAAWRRSRGEIGVLYPIHRNKRELARYCLLTRKTCTETVSKESSSKRATLVVYTTR